MSDHKNSRLCVIQKWDHFDGYGFNLHAEKGRHGQYIGKVDDGSPAEAAGLRQGDKILEVNGESIANKTHKQVVELIKSKPDETTLLVEDSLEDNNSVNTIIPTDTKDSKDEKKQQNGNANNDMKKEHENGILNLNMTAAELRAKLAAKKRFDPKKESMDFKQKFDIVQKL